jgi:hypothetical protein
MPIRRWSSRCGLDDRDLTADIEIGERLLPALADLVDLRD